MRESCQGIAEPDAFAISESTRKLLGPRGKSGEAKLCLVGEAHKRLR